MWYDLHSRVLPNHGANAEPLGDAATPIRIVLHPIQTLPVEERPFRDSSPVTRDPSDKRRGASACSDAHRRTQFQNIKSV